MKKREISRRGVLKGSLMASALSGTASFFGPVSVKTCGC